MRMMDSKLSIHNKVGGIAAMLKANKSEVGDIAASHVYKFCDVTRGYIGG